MSTISNGRITINKVERRLYLDGEEKFLNRRAFRFLTYLVENKGKALTYKEIQKRVWGEAHGGEQYRQYVRVVLSELRVYPAIKESITVISGIGMRLDSDEASEEQQLKEKIIHLESALEKVEHFSRMYHDEHLKPRFATAEQFLEINKIAKHALVG